MQRKIIMAFDYINSSEIIPNTNQESMGMVETGKISVSTMSPYNEIINEIISQTDPEPTPEKLEEAKDLLTRSDFVSFMEKFKVDIPVLEKVYNPQNSPDISQKILDFMENFSRKETPEEKNIVTQKFIEKDLVTNELVAFYSERIQEKIAQTSKNEFKVVSKEPTIIETKTEISSTITAATPVASPTTPLPPVAPTTPSTVTVEEAAKAAEALNSSVTVVTKETTLEKTEKTAENMLMAKEARIEQMAKEFEKTNELIKELSEKQKNEISEKEKSETSTSTNLTTNTTVLGTQITPSPEEKEFAQSPEGQKQIMANLQSAMSELGSTVTNLSTAATETTNNTAGNVSTNNVTGDSTNTTQIVGETTQVSNMATGGAQSTTNVGGASIQTTTESPTIKNTTTQINKSAAAPAPSATSPASATSTEATPAAATPSASPPASTPAVSPVASAETKGIDMSSLEKKMTEMVEAQKSLFLAMQEVSSLLQSPLMVINTGGTQIH